MCSASRLIISLPIPQIVCNLCFLALWEPKPNELVKSVEVFRTEMFLKNWGTCFGQGEGDCNLSSFPPTWFRILLCCYRYIISVVSDGKVVNIDLEVFCNGHISK